MAALSPDRKRELLSRVPLFAGLGRVDLDALVPVTRSESFKARQEVFHKGDPGAALYVVIEGRLKALTTSAEGDDVVFNIMGPGEVFGEIALLGENRRTATVAAIERCELLALDRRDFMAFLKKNPDVSISLLGLLADRLKSVSELVEDTQFLNLPVRLAKKLVAISDAWGEEGEAGIKIDLKLSQEEWGDLVGATRESINKQLRAWAEEGLVELEAGYLRILDPERMERLADFSLV